MIEIRNSKGDVISYSRNYRGLRVCVGRDLVKTVAIDEIGKGEGKLMILFDNGNSCEDNWGCYQHLKHVLGRWRNLRGVPLIVNGVSSGTVSPDNPELQ